MSLSLNLRFYKELETYYSVNYLCRVLSPQLLCLYFVIIIEDIYDDLWGLVDLFLWLRRIIVSFSGNTRARYPSGRGSGFRNDGGRGRGNYGGGRGYSHGDFNGRSEFNNKGGNRGGSANRGGDGYQRTDNMGGNNGRMNHGGGMPNGAAKNMPPRVSATA